MWLTVAEKGNSDDGISSPPLSPTSAPTSDSRSGADFGSDVGFLAPTSALWSAAYPPTSAFWSAAYPPTSALWSAAVFSHVVSVVGRLLASAHALQNFIAGS